MAVKRSSNFLNQQRIDVPHMRSIESAIRSDFDELISSYITGQQASYVIRGFELNMIGAIGASASGLQMIVDNSSLLHGKSTQSGTFFKVATGVPNQIINSTTNTAVQGSFTPSAINYIGIEFSRAVDNTTTAQVFLWNPTNKNEISKTVPLAETLNYKIVVTSSTWASNVLPISIVETDSSNNVLNVEDRRPMLFRLGTGGPNTPNPFYKYPWSHDAEGRTENFWKSTSAVSPFRGGDKQIKNEKEFYDAVMSMFLEIKGTTYWYSPNTGGSITKLRGDLAHLQMTGTGKFTHAKNTAGELNWDSDVFFNYIGSRLSYKLLSYPTGTNCLLADGQVAYINIVRGVDVIPNLIFTQSSATVSSVGAASWTTNILAGDYIKVGSQDDTKYYNIQSVDTASQVTLASVFLETSTDSGGTQGRYAYGTYQTAAVPTTNRHVYVVNRKDVPFNEDVYWIFMREDNGGSTARAYIRGSSGGELQQGEDREISDNTSIEVLEYIGSSSEVDNAPNYTNAMVTGLPELRTITFPAASSLTSGQSFHINTSGDLHKYYVWANINGAGGDPTPAGLTPIAVALLSSDTNLQVAAKYYTALNAISYFNVTNNLNGSLQVDNSQIGTSINAANVDMAGTFNVNTTQEGSGSYNHVVVDDENLTKAIKRLDDAIGVVQSDLIAEPYQESISIITGSPSNDQQITGPVTAGTSVKLPKNTRNSSVQETFVVGKADIEIFLNSNELIVGKDYTEVGISGNDSFYVQFTFQLVVGDVVNFRKITSQGSGSGSGSASGVNLGAAADGDVFKQTIGSQLQFRRLKAGANITMVQNVNDVTISSTSGVAPTPTRLVNGVNSAILASDGTVHGINSGVDITFTLPDATSVEGQFFYFKKRDTGNTLYIKSVFGQLLDSTNIDAAPKPITVQNESLTIQAMGGSWWIS